MARLLTVGYEVEAPGNAVLGAENPNAAATTGTLTRDTTNQRSGAGCLGCNGSTGLAASAGLLTPALSTTYYIRAFVRVATLPTATTIVLGPSGAAGVSARLTSAGKLQLWNNVTAAQIGSDSAATIATGTYYRVELQIVLNGSTQVASGELRLDGVTVATFTGLTLTSAAVLVGWVASPGTGSKMLYVDDVAVNDSTGTKNNTWPGDGKVVVLLPVSDNAVGTGWTGGAGGTTGLWDAVNNTPPTGAADPGTNATQIRNATSTTATAYAANLTDYTTAGVGASDTVNAVMPWIATGAPVVTSAKLGQYGLDNNPASSALAFGAGGTAGAFWSGVAAGAYPTGWKWSPGSLVETPALTLGTSPRGRVTVTTTSSTRIAIVCFMGAYVDYTPFVVAPTGKGIVAAGRRDMRSGSIPHLMIR